MAWHANELKEQSVNISQAIYESNWYDIDLKLRRILHIVMIRAQRPLILSIGPFFTLTNETAVTVRYNETANPIIIEDLDLH
ncbi:hypothetical protein JTB14_014058 [Gonioctena quinquepunctata]|nr:hypothetical protein JTB14_014058 [Gonioctena quinquepunctata]